MILPMLTAQRKELLLSRLATERRIVAKTLAQELGTSEDTIRRDLRELAHVGLLQRVHGGALPVSPAVGSLAVRAQVSSEEKVQLGRYAASLIQKGQVVILDGGTTAVQVARHLPPNLHATVVTHSPNVAVELAAHPEIEILMLGGRLFRHSMVNVGCALLEGLAHLRADLYFMGVTGVHPEVGFSTGDGEEAAVKRALHAHSAETVVLASAEKLLAASPFVIGPLSGVASLVVSYDTSESTLRALQDGGATVRTAWA